MFSITTSSVSLPCFSSISISGFCFAFGEVSNNISIYPLILFLFAFELTQLLFFTSLTGLLAVLRPFSLLFPFSCLAWTFHFLRLGFVMGTCSPFLMSSFSYYFLTKIEYSPYRATLLPLFFLVSKFIFASNFWATHFFPSSIALTPADFYPLLMLTSLVASPSFWRLSSTIPNFWIQVALTSMPLFSIWFEAFAFVFLDLELPIGVCDSSIQVSLVVFLLPLSPRCFNLSAVVWALVQGPHYSSSLSWFLYAAHSLHWCPI